MNTLDTVAIFFMVLFMGLGIYNGLIRSISSLVSIFAGLFLAKQMSPALSNILSFIHIPDSKGLIGFLIVFLFFFIIIKIAFFFIEKFSRKSVLSKADRVLGGFLGMVKGAVIIVFLVTIMQIVLPRDADILAKSRILPSTNKFIVSAKGIVPDDIHKHILKSKR
ncbi:MAG TPA: CvpA family protein [Deltaproteobacteria bacterium]|nr:CvpA family protein [Deltaproteobacteria bacterium]